MCGFVVSYSPSESIRSCFEAALDLLEHRGPDGSGSWASADGRCLMGHRRLSVIDLSLAGSQPFSDPDGRYRLVFNGEIYNFVELRTELQPRWHFRTKTDTEVLLAAFAIWGEDCLNKLYGMFSFVIWDSETKELFAARDRFGVKPLYFSTGPDGALTLASEIKALHGLGVSARPDEMAWRTYFVRGLYDHADHTFFQDIHSLPAGHILRHSTASPTPKIAAWYDVEDRVRELGQDSRTENEVMDELFALLIESVRLRLRSDVPVGLSLSGGLDSGLLFGLLQRLSTTRNNFQSFTFKFGDNRYDETPWTRAMLEGSGVLSNECLVRAESVPELASRVQYYQDEPFGGLPTLGLAAVHLRARELGVTVLLDGNGLDEGWAGYDYYQKIEKAVYNQGPVQGSSGNQSLISALRPEFLEGPTYGLPEKPFEDDLLNFQHRDLVASKIPRAMRFADRVSMMASRELREPFLDHRIVELGLRQPANRRIRDGQGKWLPRMLAKKLLPGNIALAPKRPVQTPQREWLRGPLSEWAESQIEVALSGWGAEWFDRSKTNQIWLTYLRENQDNSFPIWQVMSLGLMKSAK